MTDVVETIGAEAPEFDWRSLIDHDAIRQSEAKLPLLLSRLAEVRAEIVAAGDAVRAAEYNRRDAAVAGGTALRDAMKAVTAAKDIHAQTLDTEADLENALAHFQQVELPAARRLAHVALDRHALAERAAAAAQRDAALAALAAADERAATATAMLFQGGVAPDASYWMGEMVPPVRVPVQPPQVETRWRSAEENAACDAILSDYVARIEQGG